MTVVKRESHLVLRVTGEMAQELAALDALTNVYNQPHEIQYPILGAWMYTQIKMFKGLGKSRAFSSSQRTLHHPRNL